MKHTSRRAWLRHVGAVAAVGVLPWPAGCDRGASTSGQGGSSPNQSFKSIDISGADFAKGLTLNLPDADGRARTLDEFTGKVVVVFFGYTQCPDVCPTTMAEIAEIRRQLGAQGQALQGIFVTVDPERDTPEVLKAYAASFGPDIVALRGTLEQTKAVAQSFKVHFSKGKGSTPETYPVDHTAASFVFDKQGRLRLFSRFGMKAEDFASDLRQLLQGS
jgi:protein SCO1